MIKTHYDCPCLDTCPLHRSIELIGGKWKMQIICSLNNNGPTRYNELIPILEQLSDWCERNEF